MQPRQHSVSPGTCTPRCSRLAGHRSSRQLFVNARRCAHQYHGLQRMQASCSQHEQSAQSRAVHVNDMMSCHHIVTVITRLLSQAARASLHRHSVPLAVICKPSNPILPLTQAQARADAARRAARMLVTGLAGRRAATVTPAASRRNLELELHVLGVPQRVQVRGHGLVHGRRAAAQHQHARAGRRQARADHVRRHVAHAAGPSGGRVVQHIVYLRRAMRWARRAAARAIYCREAHASNGGLWWWGGGGGGGPL